MVKRRGGCSHTLRVICLLMIRASVNRDYAAALTSLLRNAAGGVSARRSFACRIVVWGGRGKQSARSPPPRLINKRRGIELGKKGPSMQRTLGCDACGTARNAAGGVALFPPLRRLPFSAGWPFTPPVAAAFTAPAAAAAIIRRCIGTPTRRPRPRAPLLLLLLWLPRPATRSFPTTQQAPAFGSCSSAAAARRSGGGGADHQVPDHRLLLLARFSALAVVGVRRARLRLAVAVVCCRCLCFLTFALPVCLCRLLQGGPPLSS